jgi:hypothetical protein
MPEEEAPEGEVHFTADARISLQPNPATDKVAIDFNLPVSGEVQVEIHSMNGAMQQRRVVHWQQGRLWMDVRDLSAGVYLVTVRLQDGNYSLKAKLVKY